MNASAEPRVRRIAVTGGPGGGKTSVLREFARVLPDRIATVPEVATLMFAHFFPPVQNAVARCAVQRAIFSVQRELEVVHAERLRGDQVLICDRGTPDGAGYWPDGNAAFFDAMAARWDDELARYDAVLFLETAAAGGLSIAEGNAVRTEDHAAAVEIDRRLRDVWSRHVRFQHVPHQQDFGTKITRAIEVLNGWLQIPGA